MTEYNAFVAHFGGLMDFGESIADGGVVCKRTASVVRALLGTFLPLPVLPPYSNSRAELVGEIDRQAGNHGLVVSVLSCRIREP